jgi:uncharacterized protein (UPF0335 family)
MLNPVDIKFSTLRTIEVSPKSMIDYAAELKFRIRVLEDELKEMEPQIMTLAERNNGKLESDLGDITLCQRKEYAFSEKVEALEEKKKKIDAQIKARQIIEISEGAACKVKAYLRYNVRLP